MSDGIAQTIYSIDTNVLMDWQARYFPTDVFKSLVEKMDVLMKDGRSHLRHPLIRPPLP